MSTFLFTSTHYQAQQHAGQFIEILFISVQVFLGIVDATPHYLSDTLETAIQCRIQGQLMTMSPGHQISIHFDALEILSPSDDNETFLELAYQGFHIFNSCQRKNCRYQRIMGIQVGDEVLLRRTRSSFPPAPPTIQTRLNEDSPLDNNLNIILHYIPFFEYSEYATRTARYFPIMEILSETYHERGLAFCHQSFTILLL